jgi:hypothetical protein
LGFALAALALLLDSADGGDVAGLVVSRLEEVAVTISRRGRSPALALVLHPRGADSAG